MKRTQVVLEKLSGTEYYGDLTVGDMIKFVPPTVVKEYESITLDSAINNMKGTGEYVRPVKDSRVGVKTMNFRQLYIKRGKDALNNFK